MSYRPLALAAPVCSRQWADLSKANKQGKQMIIVRTYEVQRKHRNFGLPRLLLNHRKGAEG